MKIHHLLPIALLMTGSAAAVGSAAGPARLEGMNYDAARSVILGYGWRPFHDACGGSPVAEPTCTRYPELNYCSGTGRGYCRMTFTRADRCLYVVTVESPPGQGGYTAVERVWFSRGACRRDSS